MSDPISATQTSIVRAAETRPSNRVPVKSLQQDDFIKILVAQLTTQDPLSPQKDTEFVGQMAQFSQMESSKTVTTELTALREQQDFVKANSLIGRRVQFDDGESLYLGSVSGVEMDGKTPLLAVGDRTFSLADVVRVDQPVTAGYPK